MASGYVKAECGFGKPATQAERVFNVLAVLVCWLIGLTSAASVVGTLAHWLGF